MQPSEQEKPRKDLGWSKLWDLNPIYNQFWRGVEVKTPAIEAVFDVFVGNVASFHALIDLPHVFYQLGTRYGEALAYSTFKFLGSPLMFPTNESQEQVSNVLAMAERIVTGKEKLPRRVQSGFNIDDVIEKGRAGSHPLGGSGTSAALDSILSSILVGSWTAYESLASDLWKAALNVHPAQLAALHGSRNRIDKSSSSLSRAASVKKSPPPSPVRKAKDWLVRLSRIQRVTRFDYDLREHMGDLLASRFKFTSLYGIRSAYSAAFSETFNPPPDKIDAALADKSFDALSAVRNLIVHKGGKADDDYIEAASGAPAAPRLAPNEKLTLSGELVESLVRPTAIKCVELVKAVDGWIVNAQKAYDAKQQRKEGRADA